MVTVRLKVVVWPGVIADGLACPASVRFPGTDVLVRVLVAVAVAVLVAVAVVVLVAVVVGVGSKRKKVKCVIRVSRAGRQRVLQPA